MFTTHISRQSYSRIARRFIISTVLLVLVAGSMFSAFAQDNGAGLSTGLLTLQHGQSIRMSAVNVGGDYVDGVFLIVPVDESGKHLVAILCNFLTASGDGYSETMKIPFPGNQKSAQFYVQLRVYKNPDAIQKLVPSLELVNDQSGSTEHIVSGNDWVAFRPIVIPPAGN